MIRFVTNDKLEKNARNIVSFAVDVDENRLVWLEQSEPYKVERKNISLDLAIEKGVINLEELEKIIDGTD